MTIPLLNTKLYIPQIRTQLLVRQRLEDRLSTGRTCKLTLVSAPAGFGKTTLLSSWIRDQETDQEQIDRQLSVAWVSLDEGDNESVRFLSYLIAALRNIKSGIGESILEMLHTPNPPPIETLLVNLVNELSKNVKLIRK